MYRDNIKEEVFPDCPIRNILARISAKWSLLVLFTLYNNSCRMRFNALQREIPDISQRMLTNTLRTLEEDGLVERIIYPEVPPHVEYSLTERALSLLPCINTLVDWAKHNMVAILKDRASYLRLNQNTNTNIQI
ncbi:MAG: helix-turn-helix domain-containing protein [Prevotellaceae bacterium]|nr:helix-turn-helix domain-containing protein [Prevotellaceae bacterium]